MEAGDPRRRGHVAWDRLGLVVERHVLDIGRYEGLLGRPVGITELVDPPRFHASRSSPKSWPVAPFSTCDTRLLASCTLVLNDSTAAMSF